MVTEQEWKEMCDNICASIYNYTIKTKEAPLYWIGAMTGAIDILSIVNSTHPTPEMTKLLSDSQEAIVKICKEGEHDE